MSIIEKAVDKLGKDEGSPKGATSVEASPEYNTLERVATAEGGAKASAKPAEAVTEQAPKATDESKAEPKTQSRVSETATAPGAAPRSVEIPLASLSDEGFLTPLTPRSQIADEFRTIKRPLLKNIDDSSLSRVDNPNVIMVTSALQGDGKTFTAINLAISIAMEQDKTVLFVDADVAKASAGIKLGVPANQPGLIDVLENDNLTVGDVMLRTNIDNLRIVAAGNVHERSNELLASRSMRQLMDELANRYPDRVIVFDSPPLLLTTEASVLASFMGQIAFVVSTDETPQQAVSEALEHIGDDKIIGMVLNKSHSRRNKLLGLGYGYGYGGYGYGYGYGYGQGQRADHSSGKT